MFWKKNIAGLFLLTLVIYLPGCKSNTTYSGRQVIDTIQLKTWNVRYDSLYNLYRQKNETKFLLQAGVFADSVLKYESLLVKDSARLTTFFNILFNRALDLNDLHNYTGSRDLLEKYTVLHAQFLGNRSQNLAYAQKTLGNIYTRYGDYKKAGRVLMQSLAYATETNDNGEIISCIINASIPLKEQKQYEEAAVLLKKLLQVKSVADKKKAIASIELADMYARQHNSREAYSQIQKARDFLSVVPPAPDRTETYKSLLSIEGFVLSTDNKPLDALHAYQKAIDSAKAISPENLRDRELGKIYIAMGNVLRQLHSYDSALLYYNRALYTVINIDTLDKFSAPQQKNLYAENTIAEALYARANCIADMGADNTARLESAVNAYKLAFETERKLLDAFSYDESRQLMLDETRVQTEKAISTCYLLYQQTKKSKWATEAFLFAEQNKSFILTESIRRNTAASLYLQNDSLYQRSQHLRNDLAMIETELRRQGISRNPDSALVSSLSAIREKKEAAYLASENDLRIRNPAYARWLANQSAMTAEELINKTLHSGGRFIEYFAGDSYLYAFSGEMNKEPGFYQLPATVKRDARIYIDYFSNRNRILNDPAGYATAANNLYKVLLGPFISTVNSSLLIIPDGSISLIPFDALLTAPDSSAGIASFPFLIKQCQINYAYSCRALIEQSNDKKSRFENTAIAFAPVFSNRERGMAPLTNSVAELEAIKQYYPDGKFFNSTAATLKQFEQSCSNSGIIHLATHAGAATDLAMPGIEFYDSTLYINRIYSMPLKARLVVLSGCETGMGSVSKTEGLMSLARGFSYAGTKNVIGSLWPTDDRMSAEIFKHFYAGLSNNNFATSLHKAKLTVLSNSSAATASPYFWSGYVYIGTPDEGLHKNSWGWVIYSALTAGLLLILAMVFRLKKKGRSTGQLDE